MSTAVIKQDLAKEIERVLVGGDISQLKPEERISYYKAVCESVGLNMLTKPFDYIQLNGKLTLYAKKDCTDQLRSIHDISITIVAREVVDECYVVTSRATKPSGRTDESIGAVPIGNLKGEAKCNAMMKAETKSKRRVTLSISGLGMLDETEIETIPSARQVETLKTAEVRTYGTPGGSANTGSGGEGKGSSSPATESGGDVGVVHGEAAGASQSAPAVPAEEKTEYISIYQQKNFHKECRAAVRPARSLEADNLIYQWLGDNGYNDRDKLPSASAIPAAGWLTVRNRAMAWLKVQ